MWLKKVFQIILVLFFFIQNFSLFALKPKREKELQKFVNEQNLKKIDKVLKENIEEEKYYLLFFSISSKNTHIVSYLIEKGLDVNFFDKNYNTPLMIACSINNNTEIVDFLLQQGANTKSKNSYSETPLVIACQIPDNIDTVKLLLKYGVNINAALRKVIEKNNFLGVKTLIENGAEINVNDSSLVKLIFDNRNLEIITLLLQRGLNPNQILLIENQEVSLIAYAIQILNSESISELLIKSGADLNIAISYKNEAHSLLYYCADIKNKNMEKLLLKYGAKLTKKEEIEKQEVERQQKIAQEKAKQERQKEIDKKRITYNNFYNQVLYENGIPLEIGDIFTIPSGNIKVVDRIVENNGYTYLVTFVSSAAENSIDYARTFGAYGGGFRHCFYITTKKALDLRDGTSLTTYERYVTNRYELKLMCAGKSQYQRNYQDVDCYIFVGSE